MLRYLTHPALNVCQLNILIPPNNMQVLLLLLHPHDYCLLNQHIYTTTTQLITHLHSSLTTLDTGLTSTVDLVLILTALTSLSLPSLTCRTKPNGQRYLGVFSSHSSTTSPTLRFSCLLHHLLLFPAYCFLLTVSVNLICFIFF